MLTIDADAHVIECEKTWDYLEGSDKRYRPVPIAVDMPTGKKQNFWIIGGRLIGTSFAGVLGALLALPVAAALQIVGEDYLRRRRARWGEETEAPSA